MMFKKACFLLALISANVTIAQVPVISPIQGPSYSCSQPAQASTYSTSATNNPSAYAWSVIPSAGVNIMNQGMPVITISFPNTSQSYTVQCFAINFSGSSSTVSAVVQVFETPTVTFTGLAKFCQGSSTFLMASPTMISGSSTLSYTWTPTNGVSNINGPGGTFNPASTTNYTLLLNSGACSNQAQVTVTVNPVPSVSVTSNYTVLCKGNTALLTISGSNDPYFINGVSTPSVASISPTINTSYIISSTNAFGCSAVTSITQSVSPCVGISVKQTEAPGLSLYPNPGHGEFHVRSSQTETATLLNETGQVIRRIQLKEGEETTITISTPGFYYLVTPSRKLKFVVND